MAAVATVYLLNASWLAHPNGEVFVLAHRGPHQRFHREGITNDSCTAAQSLPITHGYLENTVPSLDAAFRLGADTVELDVHPTTDGEFAVFHDWSLGCRTDGKGVTRDQTMAYLRTLDIAYGYTADGGKTYPLRGQGVGLMPTLEEVLRRFPGHRFWINIKSNDPTEGDRLAAYLQGRKLDVRPLVIVGDVKPGERVRARLPNAQVLTKRQTLDCTYGYVLWGWLDRVPSACRGAIVVVPLNLRHLAWGWPNRFLVRMQKAGATVYLGGDADFKRGSVDGLDSDDQLRKVPPDWKGGVITDRIEVVGPLLKATLVRR